MNVTAYVSADTDGSKVATAIKRLFTYAGLQAPTPNTDVKGMVQVGGVLPAWQSAAAAKPTTIDESGLLDSESLDALFQNVGKGAEDCSKQPKACANCSCGRKEMEDKLGPEEAKKRLEEQKVQSSCGKCGMGDAFRCGTCPYKGLPAFRPGEKVSLDLAGDGTTGAQIPDGAVSATIGDDGKVQLLQE